MIEVILHTDFACAPEGHTVVRFKAGDVLTGKAAQMAIDADVGFSPVDERKITPRLENKRGRK
jgi:hypothetical protein